MQITQKINFPIKPLIFTLTALGGLCLIVSLFKIEFELFQGFAIKDLGYFVTPVITIGLSVSLSLMYRGRGSHGIAWIFFTISKILFFSAEMVYEPDLEYNINDISTFAADILWISGYPFLFAFLVFFLKPFKKFINKNMIIKISLISVALVTPSLYILYNYSEMEPIDNVLTGIYPILSGIMLVPTLLGALLFFKGEMNSLWLLMVFGLMSDLVGDHLYTVSNVFDEKLIGSLSDLFYQWGYILYAFAVLYFIKLFRMEYHSEKINKKMS